MSSVAGPKGGGVGGHANAHNRLTPNLVQRNKGTDGQMEKFVPSIKSCHKEKGGKQIYESKTYMNGKHF